MPRVSTIVPRAGWVAKAASAPKNTSGAAAFPSLWRTAVSRSGAQYGVQRPRTDTRSQVHGLGPVLAPRSQQPGLRQAGEGETWGEPQMETVTVGGRELIKETFPNGVVRWFTRGEDGELRLLFAKGTADGRLPEEDILEGARILGVDPLPYLTGSPSEPDMTRWWLMHVGALGKHPSELSPQELNRFWVELFRTYRKMYNPSPAGSRTLPGGGAVIDY